MFTVSSDSLVKIKASKVTLFIAAALIANAVVLYLSVTNHSPDYLQGGTVSEQKESRSF